MSDNTASLPLQKNATNKLTTNKDCYERTVRIVSRSTKNIPDNKKILFKFFYFDRLKSQHFSMYLNFYWSYLSQKCKFVSQLAKNRCLMSMKARPHVPTHYVKISSKKILLKQKKKRKLMNANHGGEALLAYCLIRTGFKGKLWSVSID